MGKTVAKTKIKPPKAKASEKLDISSYACRVMIFGAVSGHGISRDMVENLCIRFSDENPNVDITKMPVVMARDDGNAVNRALLSLIKEFRTDCSTISEDGKTALMVGPAAKEIVSSLRPKMDNAQKLRTKYRIGCPIPLKRKFKCFNGLSVGERIDDGAKTASDKNAAKRKAAPSKRKTTGSGGGR